MLLIILGKLEICKDVNGDLKIWDLAGLHPGGLGGSRSNMIGLPSRKGRIRSAERVEAHLSASSLRHLLSARCADTGRFDERRSLCRLIRMGRHALFPTVPISAI